MRPLTDEEQALVLAHIHVAEIAACEMYRKCHMRMTLEEMVSSAFYGLCLASQKFKPGKVKFSSYAQPACRQQIRDDIMALAYTIHLPRHTFSKQHRAKIYKSPIWAAKARAMHADADRVLRLRSTTIKALEKIEERQSG